MLFIADDPGIYPVILPAPGIHRTCEPEGDGSVFDVLEGCGGPMDSASGFVALF